MDSVNSGSLQSSSGGDEEYDSRAESISAFLNPPSSHHDGPMPNPPPPPPQLPHYHHHHHTQTPSMFDPLSNYFEPSLSTRSPPPLSNPNSLLNLDMVWSKTLRSDLNSTDLGPIMGSPSSNQPFSTSQGQSRASFATSSPGILFPPAPENAARASASSASSDQTNLVRNSKKRSRASRRAPTTVLTTDTTNFRAMVQEFTGIPAPPFTSSPFPRSRFDLFSTASTMRTGLHLDNTSSTTPPPYLLRPFAQKVQPVLPFVSSSPSSFPSSSFASSTSMVDAIASTTNITSGSSNASNSTSINYQLPSDLALLKNQPQNLLLNMHTPILTFQSLLQTPPRYPLPNSPILPSKPQEIPSNDPNLKMGVFEEFGLSHGQSSTHLTGLPNIVSSDGPGSNHGDQGLLRSLNGNYGNSQRVITNGKINYSTSSSDFHGDKGSENVSTRSEGMVESWICSSD